MIHVVGLGPGDAGLITRETWCLLEQAKILLLRTAIHPTVSVLDRVGIHYETYDAFYDEASDFPSLYARIVDDVVTRAKKGVEIVYAVPGSPQVAEKTVVLLRERCMQEDVEINIHAGMSFLEILFAETAIDPIQGLTVLDAVDIQDIALPETHLVITQVYDKQIASDLKLHLMEFFPDDTPILYTHNLGLTDVSIREIPLYALDRQDDIDHLTSLLIKKDKIFA